MMSSWKWLAVVACLGLAACGSDDPESPAGAAGNGSGGNGAAGSSNVAATPIGNCKMAASNMCIFYECLATSASCDATKTGYVSGCDQAGGVWTDVADCSKADIIGTCRVATTSAATYSTFYTSGGLSADDMKTGCEAGKGTWIAP